MRCLAKAPDERPATAVELDAELARVTFDRPWTQARAREWWELHAPDLGAASR
jgi:hypothetical protein